MLCCLLFSTLRSAVVVASLFTSITSFAQTAEAVWVEAGQDTNSLILTELAGDKWLDPSIIHSSDNPLSRPAMATLSDGTKMLIWSEQQQSRSVLMSMRKAASVDVWQTPRLFSALGVENTGASLLADLNDQLWVFWAANTDGLDDIYYVKESTDLSAEPVRVNAANEVPDNLPMAINLQTGNVQLSWQSFNFVSSSYLVARKEFEVDVPLDRLLDSTAIKEELSPTDVSLPEQINSLNPGILHFPTNRLVQTYPLNSHGL